ncbi:MAG: hypothetical protein JEZ09_04825 [Salinivirgaceae bacterium]|nr:hypothetical protein [Salinivirgaceae bacterium]
MVGVIDETLNKKDKIIIGTRDTTYLNYRINNKIDSVTGLIRRHLIKYQGKIIE